MEYKLTNLERQILNIAKDSRPVQTSKVTFNGPSKQTLIRKLFPAEPQDFFEDRVTNGFILQNNFTNEILDHSLEKLSDIDLISIDPDGLGISLTEKGRMLAS